MDLVAYEHEISFQFLYSYNDDDYVAGIVELGGLADMEGVS